MTSIEKHSMQGHFVKYLVIMAWCILSFPISARGETITPKKPPEKRQLNTIIVDNYYPYTFVNERGEPDGFSVDLMKAVAQEMGLALNIRVDKWEVARNALANGDIQVLPMMAYSKERDRFFDFSVPHTVAYDAFLTRKKGSEIHSPKDLPGRRIIVMKHDQAHDYLLSSGLVEPGHLILVDSLPDALKQLSSGNGDAALMPKLVGLILAKKLGFDNLQLSSIVIDDYNRPFSFAVKEGNKPLLDRLSQGLSLLKASGAYDGIYENWFGALGSPALTFKTALKYISWIVLIFLVVGSVLLLWSFSLKRQVALRTKALEQEIAERRQAEKDRQGHIHFLENLDRINRVIQQSEDMDRMLKDVTDTTLAMFYCDRVWLLYPCDPDAPFFRVPIESTRPEYPGAKESKLNVSMVPSMMQVMRKALLEDGPVSFDPETREPIPPETQERFGVQSQMIMAIRPKISKPWLFGMHQCAFARTWSEQERRLFKEIGRRITDSVNNMLYHNELAETRNLFHAVLEQSPIPMIVADLDATLNMVNPACRDNLGIEDLPIAGKALNDMVQPWKTCTWDGKPLGEEDFPLIRAIRGETVREELLRVDRKDGTSRWILASASPILNDQGSQIAALMAFPDVTPRKRAEEALRESEEKYRSIIENIEEGYYEIDLKGKFTFWNDSLCRIYGYPPEELAEMNIRSAADEEATKKGNDVFKEVYLTGQPRKGFEWPFTKKDGTQGIVESSVTLKRDSKGKPVGFRGILRDISERHQLEAQLHRAQKMEALGTLSGGIAHDFNNLLMAIQGRISLMMVDEEPSSNNYRQLKLIEDHVESAANLTKQLLGFARGGKYEVKPTDLNELIGKENRMFGRTKKEITIHGNFEEDLWPAEVDRGQIEQVLLNLYVNAWQAMSGAGDLFIQTENVTIDESYVKPYRVELGRYVKISVTDTGVGMDKAIQEKIFDPFFTTKGMGRGTGLGLASAYGIVKNHGGFINVYSEKGYGTTFNIYLPASEKKVAQEKKPAISSPRGAETVLLIDDEIMILDVARDLLERLGYTVLKAESGNRAVEIYKKNKDRIDIVVLDMIMPKMSGSDTYDRLKEINPRIKVLLSSGYSINGQATEILDRGCNGFIQKPFKIEELSRKLREILDNVARGP